MSFDEFHAVFVEFGGFFVHEREFSTLAGSQWEDMEGTSSDDASSAHIGDLVDESFGGGWGIVCDEGPEPKDASDVQVEGAAFHALGAEEGTHVEGLVFPEGTGLGAQFDVSLGVVDRKAKTPLDIGTE